MMGCSKTYRDRNSDDKPFTCDYPGCGLRYYKKGTMVRHQEKAHQMVKKKKPRSRLQYGKRIQPLVPAATATQVRVIAPQTRSASSSSSVRECSVKLEKVSDEILEKNSACSSSTTMELVTPCLDTVDDVLPTLENGTLEEESRACDSSVESDVSQLVSL